MERLRTDLAIGRMALLCGTGLAEGWVWQNECEPATLRVTIALFARTTVIKRRNIRLIRKSGLRLMKFGAFPQGFA